MSTTVTPSVVVRRGEMVSGDRLSILVKDEFGAPIIPEYIRFSIFDTTEETPFVDGQERREPNYGGSPGYYQSRFTIDGQAKTGIWEIRWYIKRDEYSSEEVVIEEFEVVGATRVLTGWEASLSSCVRDLIYQLRVLIADDAPDRRYHLRPPDHGVKIQNFTTRFGYVWESPQLLFCLNMAVGAVNLSPPRTFFKLEDYCSPNSGAGDWAHLLIMRAAAFAFRIEQTRWIADEFNYSIGSLSLDIQKSDKYSAQADAFEQTFLTQLEMAKRTLKYVVGLRMSRFAGVSGLMSFGPSTARQSLVNYPSLMRG